jgi:response regulator RpfG family c-di-GMP phosphodiesterase
LRNELFKEDVDKKTSAGLFKSFFGNMIVSLAPIVNDSNNIKSGTVIAVKFINPSYLNKLSNKAGFSIDFKSIDNVYDLPVNNNLNSLTAKKQTVFFDKESTDKDYLICYLKLKGIDGRINFILTCKLERNSYVEAKNQNTIIMYILTIIGVIIILVTTNSIQFAVIKPIRILTMKLFDIRKAEDITLRTDMTKRKDEIGILSNEFDSLLGQLETSIEEKEKVIQDKMLEIKETRNDAIFRLTMAIESRDAGSAKHIERTRKMMTLFASKLDMSQERCEMYGIASTLHDIGKIGVPEYILGKTGKYTSEEFDSMKTHTLIGGNIFSDGDTELIDTAHKMAMYHHEWWDGDGYIEGLKKGNIPLPARMMTIIDVFNGMLSKRKYRKDFTADEVIEYMNENEGKIFDPALLHIFLENIQDFIEIINSHTALDKPVKL